MVHRAKVWHSQGISPCLCHCLKTQMKLLPFLKTSGVSGQLPWWLELAGCQVLSAQVMFLHQGSSDFS